MFKVARWLLALLCSCTLSKTNAATDEEVERIAQGIIDKYPNGWTNVRDIEQFYCALNWWCPEPELINSDSDSDNNLTEDQRKALASRAINILYDRTRTRLYGNNNNLLISFLRYGAGTDTMGSVFESLLKEYLEEQGVGEDRKKQFIRDSLWAVQLGAMKKSTKAMQHDNVSYALIYKCIWLSAGDEDFIYNEIVNKMNQYGFGSMVPHKLRK